MFPGSVNDRKPFLSVTLKDCDVQTFAAGGKGGQRQNTCNTGVRVIHGASGARGEARDSRSQHENKKAAFRRMVESPKFRIWLNRMIWQGGMLPEQQVNADMSRDKLLIEGRCNGEWVPIS